MSNSKDLGKLFGRNSQEAQHNIERAAPLYPQPHRTVDNVDPYNIYKKSFDAGVGTSAYLNATIKEMPTPCTVNPPKVISNCTTSWIGDYIGGPCPMYAGYLTNYHILGGSFVGTHKDPITDETVNDYIIGTDSVTVTQDGCYLLRFHLGNYGLSYFADATTSATLLHNGFAVHSAAQEWTGVISILGPPIFYWPSVSNLYGIIEAKAGDTIGCTQEATGFSKCKGWYGTYLRGLWDEHPATLTITLVAKAEATALRPNAGGGLV